VEREIDRRATAEFCPDARLCEQSLDSGRSISTRVALLFTTKFEGFGIPLLEAFYCGCPAITSNSGSCLEVAGARRGPCGSPDPASIAGGILRLAG
jgi:hypothetical protein